MPDMTDLPDAPEQVETAEQRAEKIKLADELESLRLMTPEDNVRYWLSDEAMQND